MPARPRPTPGRPAAPATPPHPEVVSSYRSPEKAQERSPSKLPDSSVVPHPGELFQLSTTDLPRAASPARGDPSTRGTNDQLTIHLRFLHRVAPRACSW